MLATLACGTFIPQLTFHMGRGRERPKMSDVVLLSRAAPSPPASSSGGGSNMSKSDTHGRPSTFKMPAYDPVPIVVMGCGILLVAALAFAF
jgi:hypothetical protein